jgi:RNA polymerase primary sigma factor
MTDVTQQQSRLKDLIAKGKEQGYLTYSEVNDHLPQDISDPDQVEDIIQMINDMGIQVFESAPDADDLLMSEGESSADDRCRRSGGCPGRGRNRSGPHH